MLDVPCWPELEVADAVAVEDGERAEMADDTDMR